MVNLSYKQGDLHKVQIVHEGFPVGMLSYDTKFDKNLVRNVYSNLEHQVLEELSNEEDVVVLNFLCIYEGYERQGFATEALALFEKDISDLGFNALAFSVPSRLARKLERLGYSDVCYADSIDEHVMIKTLSMVGV